MPQLTCCLLHSTLPLQINELSHVNIPVMLLPDDFRAFSKIKVDNHLFNKYVHGAPCLFLYLYLSWPRLCWLAAYHRYGITYLFNKCRLIYLFIYSPLDRANLSNSFWGRITNWLIHLPVCAVAPCRENMPSHFKVKEYCPLVFRNLRERFNVDDVDYRESLTRSQPLCIDSAGKSGAAFYQSYDKLYILKSLTSEEVERMHSFLKHYHPVGLFYLPKFKCVD